MARQLSRAEAWEAAHTIFTQVNFNAFDFNSIKESLLDYTKLYFPEDFNDYIESSEFVAQLELFAYVGELLAYRLDLNAHENLITTAQRKESILRLAKLISYKASRNIPARGLVKITSIQTTENIVDSQGRNLAGRRIYWNDNNNSDWKEQFILIINRALEQEFGTVAPNDRVQVDDVLFELYTLNNNPLNTDGRSVFPFSTVANGQTVPMELVPTQLTQDGPIEKRPELNAKFSVVYANDGLGDGSDTTGFMLFSKQGTLNRRNTTFDGVTPNQTYDINIDDINETDLWINNVDSDTGEILIQDPYAEVFPHLVSEDLRYGEWVEVDLANAQNIIFNTNKNRHKYEVETLDNDQIRIVFGDGEFSDVPSGTFHVWFRTSVNDDIVIEKNAVIDQPASFTYTDLSGNVQTISFTFSLVNSLLNASASEDIEHIRRVAPSVYYTQDRMVNGRDYNTFMLQDPSILKLRALNRTFAGDSKYIAWHDPRENYEDVKIFGDDLALFWDEQEPLSGGLQVVSSPLTSNQLLFNVVQPLLSSTDFFATLAPLIQEQGGNPADMRLVFNDTPYSFGVDPATGQDNEIDALLEAFDLAATTSQSIVDIYYSTIYDEWTVAGTTTGHVCDLETSIPPTAPTITGCDLGPADSLFMIRVEAQFDGSGQLSGWDVRWRSRRLVAQSEQTRFWNSNTTNDVVNFDTLESRLDSLVLLKANVNGNGDGILSDNLNYTVLGQEMQLQNLPNAGIPDEHKLSVLPQDTNGDGLPDNLLQQQLIDADFTVTWDQLQAISGATGTESGSPSGRQYVDVNVAFGRTINNSSTKGLDNDVEVYLNGSRLYFAGSPGDIDVEQTQQNDLIFDKIAFNNTLMSGSPQDTLRFVFKDYVYFVRETNLDPWVPVEATDDVRVGYMVEDQPIQDDQLFNRFVGRYPLNFAWFHNTPRLNLVDPAASNIIDIFIITKGYYTSLQRWLSNQTTTQPTAPTPLTLRTNYSDLLDNKMISDTVVLHSGNFKILFGSKAIPQLRAKLKVVRPVSSSLTDNQVRVQIVNVVRQFFDINSWEFGETFFFSELSASIHAALGPEIDSVVLVPTYANNQFGDLYQIQTREDELFIPDINTSDIEIIQSLTPDNIRQQE